MFLFFSFLFSILRDCSGDGGRRGVSSCICIVSYPIIRIAYRTMIHRQEERLVQYTLAPLVRYVTYACMLASVRVRCTLLDIGAFSLAWWGVGVE